VVLYRSPTQSIDLVSYGVRNPAQAVEAAKLACTDSLSYSTLSAVCEGAMAGRDQSGQDRQSHVVVAAEREDIAEALTALVNDSGLVLQSLTPMDAAVAGNLLRTTLTRKAEHQGILQIGEHASFFLVVHQGRLLFSRRIDLGLHALASSLTRPIRRRTGEPVELTSDEARTMLHEHGFPDRDSIVHEEHGLTGGQIIPLLQPVLQRFVVELRQSIRFGVDEQSRGHLQIKVVGPGASLQGLPGLLGKELDVQIDVDERSVEYDWRRPGGRASELAVALKDRAFVRLLNLLPREVSHRRRAARLKRWLWTGAATALAVVAFDGFRSHARLSDVQREAEAYATQLRDHEALKETSDRLELTLSAIDELRTSVDHHVGVGIDLRACLHELTQVTPASVKLTSLDFQQFSDTATGTISGFAFAPDSTTERTELERFMAALEASPLFEKVGLGSVYTGSIGNTEGQRFEAMFTIREVARSYMPDATLVQAEDEVQP